MLSVCLEIEREPQLRYTRTHTHTFIEESESQPESNLHAVSVQHDKLGRQNKHYRITSPIRSFILPVLSARRRHVRASSRLISITNSNALIYSTTDPIYVFSPLLIAMAFFTGSIGRCPKSDERPNKKEIERKFTENNSPANEFLLLRWKQITRRKNDDGHQRRWRGSVTKNYTMKNTNQPVMISNVETDVLDQKWVERRRPREIERKREGERER